MRRWFGVLGCLAALFCLTGCSMVAFFLSGCGGEDADLVVVNDSSQAVYAITLDYGGRTETVQNARGDAMLKRGESFGLPLEQGTATVTLSGAYEERLASLSIDFQGERLCLTLGEGGALQLSAFEPK